MYTICGGVEGNMRSIEDWLDFWQQRLTDKVSISDIEAEAALSELDRIMRTSIQKTRAGTGNLKEFDSFYLKRIL